MQISDFRYLFSEVNGTGPPRPDDLCVSLLCTSGVLIRPGFGADFGCQSVLDPDQLTTLMRQKLDSVRFRIESFGPSSSGENAAISAGPAKNPDCASCSRFEMALYRTFSASVEMFKLN